MGKKTDPQLIKGYIFFCTVLVLAFLCFAAYKIQPYKSGAEYRGLKDYSEQDGTALVSLTINDFPITINTFAAGSQYETAWLTTETETTFTFGTFEACRFWLNGIEVFPGQSVLLKIDSISDANLIPIRIVDNRSDYDRTVYLRTLPTALPTIYVKAYHNEEQMLSPLLCAVGSYIVKYDCFGNVLFYRLSANAVDFQSVLTDNGKRYTFLERVTGETNGANGGYKAVVMNEHYQVIDIIDSITLNGETFPLYKNGFQMISDGDYILTAAVPTVLYPDAASEPEALLGDRSIVYYLARRSGGEILWTWDSAKVPVVPQEDVEESVDGEYRDNLCFSDLVYSKTVGKIAVSFDHAEEPVILDATRGVEISSDTALRDKETYKKQSNMNLRAEYQTQHSMAWAQMDENGAYLLVSYADVDRMIGSVYDMRTNRLLEDLILSRNYEEIYFDKITFDAA